ncbi:3-hydroxyisobutyrate dehydrogenase [Ningiella sp. W23]|uniref:3-hydroxyisobutyrate dehydrogenase n=1 Tax=Ningiella sp. W23 TaxID=3023715 RepID=UPI0037568FAD
MDNVSKPSIAFFGLGNMGAGMAENLLKAGYVLYVYDLFEAQVKALENKGAIAASSPQEAIKDAEMVISMLPASKHVESLYLDEQGGLINSAKKGTVFIDCSTIEANTARKLNAALSQAGFSFADAPVSGGVAGAAAGTLTFIVGGQSQTVEAIRAVLEAMGSNIFHAGDAGAGQVAKICNNMLLAILMAGTSEALQLAIDNGLDPVVMSNIMKKSSGDNWTLQKYNPCPNVMENVPSSNDYQGGFLVDLMNKDLGLAMAAASANQSNVPLGELAQSLYRAHADKGNGSKDFSSIFQSLKDK